MNFAHICNAPRPEVGTAVLLVLDAFQTLLCVHLSAEGFTAD